MKDPGPKNQIKILMLIPNLDFGGAQRVFFEISSFLATKYDVEECSFSFEEGHAFRSNQNIHSLHVTGGKNIIEKITHFFMRCIRYRKLKNQQRIDVSISHLEGANYVNVLSGGRCVNIIVEHGSKLAIDDKRTGWLGWVRKEILIPILFRMADHIVVVSKGIEEELVGHFKISKKKITVINNSFNIPRIEALASEPLGNEEFIFQTPVIIASGRLVAEKNLFPLFDLLSKMKEQSKCRLVLIGEGELKEKLIAYASQMKLKVVVSNTEKESSYPEADVYFLGYQSNPFKYLSRASLFVLPSTREGFPLALCEALICKVPVMAADCATGPREILAPNTSGSYDLQSPEKTKYGILMPHLTTQSIDVWLGTANALLGDSELQNNYRVDGYARMQAFSTERIMNEWIDLIEEKVK